MDQLSKEIKSFLEKETRLQRAYLWGKYCVFKPAVLSKIFGDGKQIIYVGSINQRPKYWLARVDSKTDVDAEFIEEQILYALEEEFGRVPDEGELTYKQFREIKKEGKFFFDHKNYREYCEDCKYPRVDWSGGHWGTIKNFG